MPLPLAVAVAIAVVAGACTLVAEIGAVTVIQRAAPPAVTARVFGVYDQLNVGAIAVGSAVAGPLAGLLGPRGSVAVTGLVVGVAGIAAARRLRVAEVRRPAPAATDGAALVTTANASVIHARPATS